MNTMRLLNEYTISHEIKRGVKIDFAVKEYIDEDTDCTIEDAGDYEDTIEAVKSGELFFGLICVKAYALGMEGSDYLGACLIHSVKWQDDSKLRKDVADCVKDHGMVEAAVKDCIRNILEQAAKLAPIIKA